MPNDTNFASYPSIYPDNSLLFNEMETTVKSIKEQNGSYSAEKKDSSGTERVKTAQLLYPYFSNGKLVVDKNLTDYGKELEKIVESIPFAKITLIGHFNDEDASLDNYFKGLKRAKQLKRYITQNLKISSSSIYAISEGESRPLSETNENVNPTKSNCIEILIEE